MQSNHSHRGTDNVLADLGFEDAEELSAKAVLAVKLSELIDKRGLSQTEVAGITGMTQPKVSQVRRYKLQNVSLERLMQALVSLDQQVGTSYVLRAAHIWQALQWPPETPADQNARLEATYCARLSRPDKPDHLSSSQPPKPPAGIPAIHSSGSPQPR